MRLFLIGLLAIGGITGRLLAEEGGPGLSPGTAEVLQAWRDEAKSNLTTLAAREDPDRWMVADELLLAGHHDAALAFALAAPLRDSSRLAAYVRGREKRTPDPAVRAALELATEMNLLEENYMGSSIYSALVAVDGVRYIATRSHLIAIGNAKR